MGSRKNCLKLETWLSSFNQPEQPDTSHGGTDPHEKTTERCEGTNQEETIKQKRKT